MKNKQNLVSSPRNQYPLNAVQRIIFEEKIKKKIAAGLIDDSGKRIDSKNSSFQSRTVSIDSKEYTRTVSEIFATDKDFKNSIDITGSNSVGFKSKLAKLRKDNNSPVNYILGQDIVNSDTKENLQLNWRITQAIVKEQYNNSWFEFIKDSGLVKLNGDKIDISELTSCRDSYGSWRSGLLGNYGCIWLRAADENGDPICIGFEEDGAYWGWKYPKTAMPVASQK